MPLYEYECEAERHRFEVIRKFSDPPVETCPTCGSKVRKLLSSPAIQFKGSGWYVTDYGRKGSTGSGGSTETSGSTEASGSTGSSESKSGSDSKSSGPDSSKKSD